MRCVCRHWEDIRCWAQCAFANGCSSFCPFLFKRLAQVLDGKGAVFTFPSSVKLLHPLLARALSCVVTVVEFVFRRAESWFKAMICSSEQCLPNLSLRALPVIICVLFASKRSVGVEAPSATRGLKMTCMYQVIKVVHNPFG